MKRTFIACVTTFLLFVIAARIHHAQQRPAGLNSEKTREFETIRERIRVVQVTDDLVSPFSLAFLPGGKSLLVTEMPGRLRIIRDGVLDPQPVWQVPPAPAYKDEGTPRADRLHSVVIHPQFAQNQWVYVSYIKFKDTENTIAVARGRFDGTTLKDVQDIFVADAWNSAPSVGAATPSARMLFGPDKTLYLTIGDRDSFFNTDNNSLRIKAQDLGSYAGKTLRLRDDGGVPADNPFVNRPGAKPEIFTYGHRNGYGLAFHPTTGELWQAEIGPMGGDEINILIPGRNYGWPIVSLGRHYTGPRVSEQPWWRPDMEMPKFFYSPTVSPSSIVFYTGDQFPKWKGNLFVGTLTSQELWRVSFSNPSSPGNQDMAHEPLLRDLHVRIRDVNQGPDGNLYVATEVRNGPGTVLRIEPAK